jgi:GTPase SAR1 family protein
VAANQQQPAVVEPRGQMTLDAIMIGPRGVGKTSLLASLYDQFPKVVGQQQLQLRAVGRTRELLQQYREELEMFARGTRHSGPGIAGNLTIVEHTFELGTPNIQVPQLKLRFTDIPGEVITSSSANPALRATFEATLRTSSVVFIAIDSPAVMEQEGEYNEETNKPKLIADFVLDAARQKANLLVVLVPLKCEKYCRDPHLLEELARRIRDQYAELGMQLAGLPTQCGMVMTTVQTVGTMVFKSYEDGRPTFRPVNVGRNIYGPQDTDQPLRWLLRFAANSYLQRPRNLRDRFSDWWNNAGGAFRQALIGFGSGTHSGRTGFQVLHQHPYLRLPE